MVIDNEERDRQAFEEEARELAELFLSTRRADLVRLEAAFAAGDLATVRSIGHIFRGSAATFGYPEAGRIGAAIEESAGRGDREALAALVPSLRASLGA